MDKSNLKFQRPAVTPLREMRERANLSKAPLGRRGVCIRVSTLSSGKLNVVPRKIARVRLTDGFVVSAYVPARVGNVQQNSKVLLRACRINALPRIRYIVLVNDFDTCRSKSRKYRRSKYGAKRGGTHSCDLGPKLVASFTSKEEAFESADDTPCLIFKPEMLRKAIVSDFSNHDDALVGHIRELAKIYRVVAEGEGHIG